MGFNFFLPLLVLPAVLHFKVPFTSKLSPVLFIPPIPTLPVKVLVPPTLKVVLIVVVVPVTANVPSTRQDQIQLCFYLQI